MMPCYQSLDFALWRCFGDGGSQSRSIEEVTGIQATVNHNMSCLERFWCTTTLRNKKNIDFSDNNRITVYVAYVTYVTYVTYAAVVAYIKQLLFFAWRCQGSKNIERGIQQSYYLSTFTKQRNKK